MDYATQRRLVVDIQQKIARVNHQLENPAIRYLDRMVLQERRAELLQVWDREIRAMRAMPEYTGPFKEAV